MPPRCFLAIVLSLFATGTALGAGQRSRTDAGKQAEHIPGLMTPAQFRIFLASLKTDLARSQSQLAEIDVNSLGLDFKGGKLIEGALTLAKHTADQCQKWVSELSKAQSLGDTVRLYSCMEGLGGDLSETMGMLSEFGGESTLPDFWQGQLLVVSKEMNLDIEKLLGHVLALSDIADSCPQLGRYLH